MTNDEVLFELQPILTLWEKDYKLAGTTNRIKAITKTIEMIKK